MFQPIEKRVTKDAQLPQMKDSVQQTCFRLKCFGICRRTEETARRNWRVAQLLAPLQNIRCEVKSKLTMVNLSTLLPRPLRSHATKEDWLWNSYDILKLSVQPVRKCISEESLSRNYERRRTSSSFLLGLGRRDRPTKAMLINFKEAGKRIRKHWRIWERKETLMKYY